MIAEGLALRGGVESSCGVLPAVFWGLSCVWVQWWVDTSSDGLVVLEQKVMSGVDARMQAVPACIRNGDRQKCATYV